MKGIHPYAHRREYVTFAQVTGVAGFTEGVGSQLLRYTLIGLLVKKCILGLLSTDPPQRPFIPYLRGAVVASSSFLE